MQRNYEQHRLALIWETRKAIAQQVEDGECLERLCAGGGTYLRIMRDDHPTLPYLARWYEMNEITAEDRSIEVHGLMTYLSLRDYLDHDWYTAEGAAPEHFSWDDDLDDEDN